MSRRRRRRQGNTPAENFSADAALAKAYRKADRLPKFVGFTPNPERIAIRDAADAAYAEAMRECRTNPHRTRRCPRSTPGRGTCATGDGCTGTGAIGAHRRLQAAVLGACPLV